MQKKLKIGILVPHLFAQEKVISKTIFAPIHLAINLAKHLQNDLSQEVILYTPGKITDEVENITTDLSFFHKELDLQGCTEEEMIVQSPLAYISMARQINAQLTAQAFEDADSGKIDILHVFMCEDEIPLYFSNLLKVPVIFTHHDPYNYYRKYRARFPTLSNLNYVSISLAQRETAPENMNWVGNVYNGLDITKYRFNKKPCDYFAFLGRIVQNKGVHHAIEACKITGEKLKIAGKFYKDNSEEGQSYWEKYVLPNIKENIEYVGFLKPEIETIPFLANSKALLFPSAWDEPFGMVMIEALACGTPVIAFDYGAVREIVEDGKNGFIVRDVSEMAQAIKKIDSIDRDYCRKSVEERFTSLVMAENYLNIYTNLKSL